jgi:RNA polymerase sigma-70 factor (ECF subfamily)
MRYWQDRTVHDIAARLGIPAGTVKSRLHHAMRSLRASLGDER